MFYFASCTPSNRPKDSFVIQEILQGLDFKSPKILYYWRKNLNDDPKEEVLYLIRNGMEEHLASFEQFNNQNQNNWKLEWKKSYSLLNIGPLEYSQSLKQWIPSSNKIQQDSTQELGYIIKNIQFLELPGDTFPSIFINILAEDPILGIFSVPIGLRKGIKILDGLSLLIEHPILRETKFAGFEYQPKDKSIIIFPKQLSYSLEMVFNGMEMIPNLSSQPIPSILKIEQSQDNTFSIELKNRGGVANVTYLTFSFPENKEIELTTKKEEIRVYKPGDLIFSRLEKKKIPAQYPMIEITKNNWGTNYRFSFGFKLKDNTNTSYMLFRASYPLHNKTEIIPNNYSVVPLELDQQSYPAYRIPLGPSHKITK